MEETIRSIEYTSWKYDDEYTIETDKNSHVISIINIQFCCENWSIDFDSDLTKEDFVGSKIQSIFEVRKNIDRYTEEDSLTVTFHTDKGSFSIECRCSHNGYYPHNMNYSVYKIEGSEASSEAGSEAEAEVEAD